MTLDVVVRQNGDRHRHGWALNEATVEKASRERMLEVVTEIDGRPLSRWGCDGVVCATPTGSTAYAFSAGGPVVWPEVEALLLVPISAHALFARPHGGLAAVGARRRGAARTPRAACCGATGGRPSTCRPAPGSRSAAGALPVRLARPAPRRPFTDRLVAKFGLPVARLARLAAA